MDILENAADDADDGDPQDVQDDIRGQKMVIAHTKQSVASVLPLLYSGYGAATAPEGKRLAGAGRGLVRGVTAATGASLGRLAAQTLGGGPVAQLVGGLTGLVGGHVASGRVLGEPSWQKKKKRKDTARKSAAMRVRSDDYDKGEEAWANITRYLKKGRN